MPSKLVCKQCGKQIWGEYVTALGANWHPEHFVCAGCGKPLTDARFQIHNDAPYHIECYRDKVAPRCTYCGKPLIGQYSLYQGKAYHDECYREHGAPRCAHCGKPLVGQYQVYEGVPYHEQCFRDYVAARCAYCRKPLVGEYLVDHWGTKYCKEHQSQYPRCAYCGRLVPPSQQESGANRNNDVRCPICRASAIESDDKAQTIFSGLQRWLASQGLEYNNLQPTVELCDRPKLATLLKGRKGTDALGVTLSTTHTLNGQAIRTDVNGVAVLRGLPITLFQGVAAHELGHVWLIVHDVKNLPSWAEEGFCELLTHRFYTGIGTAEARYHAESIEKNPDQVYGEGFRRVRAIADRMGFARFVEVLQRTKRVPSS
jgi:LIM domain/Protein DA1